MSAERDPHPDRESCPMCGDEFDSSDANYPYMCDACADEEAAEEENGD